MLTYKEIINEIHEYKRKIQARQIELQNFLNYLDQKVFKRMFCFCAPCKATLAPSFQRAFSTLNEQEKADYYLTCLKMIDQVSHNKIEEQDLPHERLEVQYKEDKGLWKLSSVILSFKQNVLEIQSIKLKLKLQNYIFRLSKGRNKQAFALESTRADCEPTTLRISHPNKEEYFQLLEKVKKMILEGICRKMARMCGVNRDSRQMDDNWFRKKICMSIELSKSFPEERKSLRRMLEATMYSDASKSSARSGEKKSQQIIDPNILENLDDYSDFEQIESGFFIHLSKERVRRVCIFKPNSCSLSWLIDEFENEDNFRVWKNSLCSIFLIANVTKETTKIYHEINIYKDGTEVDYVFFRNKFKKGQAVYFVDKSISTAEYGSHETSSSRGNIQYCVWRIREAKENSIEIVAQAQINHLPCSDIYQAMKEQIGELENIILCKKISRKSKKPLESMQFYSISQKDFQLESLNKDVPPGVHNKESLSVFSSSSFYSIISSDNTLLLKSKPSDKEYRYHLSPYFPSEKLIKQFPSDKFFDERECKISQIGDLIFTNKEKIKEQGASIMKLLKRIGNNLIGNNKNIQNVCFPIQIFGKDTNLERLCRSMAYAPCFLENKTHSTPLQRMKAAICFAVGNLLLYIDMSKPFNPMLGETYQGFIDGCPVYGQQTSHHPYISSLFLVGRDYFVSGNIESTVLLNMNSISGTNLGEYKIAFHKTNPEKNTVIFTSPPGELSGIIYGQRKLNMIETSRFYDPENQLFCELKWGKTKSNGTVCRYHDYLEGKIVQLHKGASKISKVKESEKDTVLGYITGRWTQSIFFNDQTNFEINKVHPFVTVDEKEPLESDARFRPDKQYVSRKLFSEAQTAKQNLEQSQRNDRKLRIQYGL